MKRLKLFPINSQILTKDNHQYLHIDGQALDDLVEQYGTPLYIYDRATLDDALSTYQEALAKYYPGSSGITYAGKAFLCLAMAQWVGQKNIWLDCTGKGELSIAAAAELENPNVLVHGVNKSANDLTCALAGAGTIVVDNLYELERIQSHNNSNSLPTLWLRLRPGESVDTHHHIQTGQEDSKFGFSLDEAAQAVRFCQQHNLPLTGIHFHQGSHFNDPAPLSRAIDISLDFIVTMRKHHNWTPQILSPGGGWGVPYTEQDLPHAPITQYVQFVAEHLVMGSKNRDLPLPHLQLEPGRSLVAKAGVAVYQVGATKNTAHRNWLLLDGGLADNPRPALYNASYTALPVRDPHREADTSTWLGGPYCESGDYLISDLPLPKLEPGELIAIPVSGAYQLSMSSNYNGACKPAVVWLENGHAHLIQRRETTHDLLRRDAPLPK
ncbi:MAG: diaminopimelate decarboxylase [Chloroflexi bacterium]|nr:diaminopimelate decarboxylase [Chloroflexota bacterium]